MSVQNFIPALWSARLLANLDKSHVFGSVVNRDWEGEIKNLGDTVHIQNTGAITISDYDPAIGLTAPEGVTSGTQSLIINQAKSFNFMVGDIDKAQANVDLVNKYTERASYGLNDVFDKFIASFYANAGQTIGTDVAPIAITGSNAYAQLSKMQTLLDEADVPSEGRFAVLPPWFYEALREQNGAMFEEAKENGRIGRLAGFDLRSSNNIAKSGTNFKIVAGHGQAITVAEQIINIEAYRPEKFFQDAVKGLHVYGGKVVQAPALITLTASR